MYPRPYNATKYLELRYSVTSTVRVARVPAVRITSERSNGTPCIAPGG